MQYIVHNPTDTWLQLPSACPAALSWGGGSERPPDVSRQLLEIRDPGLDSADPLLMWLLIPTLTALRPARAQWTPSQTQPLQRERTQSASGILTAWHRRHEGPVERYEFLFAVLFPPYQTVFEGHQGNFESNVGITSCLCVVCRLIENIKMISHITVKRSLFRFILVMILCLPSNSHYSYYILLDVSKTHLHLF